MSHTPEIAIVLPFYNPALGWDDLVVKKYNEIAQCLPRHTWQMILINDGSSADLSQPMSRLSELEYITTIEYKQNRGKGYALRYGLSRTQASIYILTDIDLPYELAALTTVVKDYDAKRGYNVWFGKRNKAYYEAIPGARKYVSYLLKEMNSRLMRLVTNDTQCGFKAMDNLGKDIFLKTKTDGFLYDLEFVKLISRDQSVRYNLLPVVLRGGVQLSSLHPLSLIKELRDFIKILKQ